MKAKSLKSSQILGAHMPYFRRPGHIFSLYKENNGIMVVSNHKQASRVANQARWKKKGEIKL